MKDFAELCCTTNFSLLTGASHPEEYVSHAATLGLQGIGICDLHTLSGVVRAHREAKKHSIPLVVGTRFYILLSPVVEVAVYPFSKEGYHLLSRTLTEINKENNSTGISLSHFLKIAHNFQIIFLPPLTVPLIPCSSFEHCILAVKEVVSDKDQLFIGISRTYLSFERHNQHILYELSSRLCISLLATNRPLYHLPHRRPLLDVVTCIREKTILEKAGFLLHQNTERYLKEKKEIYYLFSHIPSALTASCLLSERSTQFSLDSITYEYPHPTTTDGTLLISDIYQHLCCLVEEGGKWRYPQGMPTKVAHLISEELELIKELRYEKYFLTCYEIVLWARARGILCQGRGAAANSAVCFCLGITSVDPATIDLLFGRFISKERDEPPDIDIDFEHERREEVIQFIYSRYGRDHAALTASVVTYRQRSAFREVAKVFSLAPSTIDTIAKSLHRWTGCVLTQEHWKSVGLSEENPIIQKTLAIADQLKGFPRHLSQHVGGFIISEKPLCEIVPIIKATMPGRTTVEWDKDDIEAQGMLKIDVLALGMLTCIRKALSSINDERLEKGCTSLTLATIPHDDKATYDMLCKADSLGVFQVESRAQMSMLPRLKPRCFYDLVIQVAIVRPGPIQGDMVHPYLRRRAGIEKFIFPDDKVRGILEKTLGVPLFQEQAMRLAIILAHFTPGEAEQLRRAMSAWKHNEGMIATFKERIIRGMVDSGYSLKFAETCMTQIRGFSEYGFPESHAASFALLVYASAWIKCHYPAHFAAGLLNSQPMGFYAPSQIISDTARHGVTILPIDINKSSWASFVTKEGTLQLGMSLVKQIRREVVLLIEEERHSNGLFLSILDLWERLLRRVNYYQALSPCTMPEVKDIRSTLIALARADAFTSLSLSSRQALWEVKRLKSTLLPLPLLMPNSSTTAAPLAPLSAQEALFKDYAATHFSLRGHFFSFIRDKLQNQGCVTSVGLKNLSHNAPVTIAGLSLIRQRPGTAKGTVFITLEDETGLSNIIVFPSVFTTFSRILLSSSFLFISGIVERTKEVVYVKATTIEAIDHLVIPCSSQINAALSVRSYSY